MKSAIPSTVVDADGNPTAVLLPIKEYEELLKASKKLQQMEALRRTFLRSFKELKQVELRELQSRSAQSFLETL